MQKLLFLICLVLPGVLFAQSFASLHVFSENHDKFYLFLDGKKQNDIPRSNIRINYLPDLFYSVKLIFEDSSIAPISKNNLYVSDADDIMCDATYRIHRDQTGRTKISFFSLLPVNENFIPSGDVYVFRFGSSRNFETVPVVTKNAGVQHDTASFSFGGSLNIFSQNEDKFFLYLNGVKQNDTAKTNIRIQNMPALYYNVKIVFNDSGIPPIVKNNLSFSDADEKRMDAVYRIRRDNNGKPKLNFYSMTEAREDFIVSQGMHAGDFQQAVSGIAPEALLSPQSTAAGYPRGSNTLAEKNEHSTVAITASKKTGIIYDKIAGDNKASPENKKCNGWPLGNADLGLAIKKIKDAAKEDDKLSAAMEIAASSCLLTGQVTEFCRLFTSEKSKLAFAKYAYRFTIDRKNYADINTALSLEASKQELNAFIHRQ